MDRDVAVLDGRIVFPGSCCFLVAPRNQEFFLNNTFSIFYYRIGFVQYCDVNFKKYAKKKSVNPLLDQMGDWVDGLSDHGETRSARQATYEIS